MMPHGETGGETRRLECLCMFPMSHDSLSLVRKLSLSALSLMIYKCDQLQSNEDTALLSLFYSTTIIKPLNYTAL